VVLITNNFKFLYLTGRYDLIGTRKTGFKNQGSAGDPQKQVRVNVKQNYKK